MPRARAQAGAARYVLVFDVLGYLVDGERHDIEGRGREFTEADLAPEAFARGIETGALVPAGDVEADDLPVEPDTDS